MELFVEDIVKPENWPANKREELLDLICDKLLEFEKNPSYKTREVLLSLVSDNEFNQNTQKGLVRFTDYEVALINSIYVKALHFNINAIKVYLYDLIADATQLQKISSWSNGTLNHNIDEDYRIHEYETGLFLSLKLYHFAYQKYIIEKTKTFAEQLFDVSLDIFKSCVIKNDFESIAYAYPLLLNDISYMRGTKKEKILEFGRDELKKLLRLEADILLKNNQNPAMRPTRGVLMTQISNFILKSRNNYNQDFICKYLSPEAAVHSIDNSEIWMRKIDKLNDDREQKVVPELFHDETWIDYEWAKGIDFSATRTYYVSSFCKSIDDSNMKEDYGECIYGYKNDRIVELISPLMKYTFKKKSDCHKELPDISEIPAISQVIAFDVIYDKEEAKKELSFLFNIIDSFYMSDDEKHLFLQDIMQYWILSVKDNQWSKERERRYVIFLYDNYKYIETKLENDFLKLKTSLFYLPDFILGNNPVREIIKAQLEQKQKTTMTNKYLHCKDCLVQDYDSVPIIYKKNCKCPVCGSLNVEIIN